MPQQVMTTPKADRDDLKVVFPTKPRQASHNNRVTLFTNIYKLVVAPINKNQTIEK